MVTFKFVLSLAFSLYSLTSFSQHKVTFIIDKLPVYHKSTEPIFLVGSFNKWKTSDSALLLKKIHPNKVGIAIELKAGMSEYKFTRGDWDKVETNENGGHIENRVINVERDTTVHIKIDHWADHFPKKEKQTTANSNVQILDTAFFIPQLNRSRRIWIYLPDSYCNTKKFYPVLYMQDGQNVFDEASSFSGEWGVDETLNAMRNEVGELIVVAIDNGGERRINEYSPFDMEEHGKGEGDAYVNFLVQILIPYINKHYRTKRSNKNTFIAGSSMGGLISLYAILKYPNKFGAAGVFSPALWIAPQINEYAASRASKVNGRIYFFAGQQESESMVPDMLAIFNVLNEKSKADMKTVIRA
ncbi:MAG TPA: alpha/beta hydrolase-fold protein, partial [Flavisolibacter sp.]|nr:alpha/beta hydrolase-fold protein [Flavisolibacter sp.]